MKDFIKRNNSKIIFNQNRVTKFYLSDCTIEYDKSSALWNISKECSFISPKPLKLNSTSNSIEFEFVRTEASIREDYLKIMKANLLSDTLLQIFNECGRILGCIHNKLILDTKTLWKPTDIFTSAIESTETTYNQKTKYSMPHTFLHCDYGFENIEKTKENLKFELAIFDSSPNYFTTFNTDVYGPVYIDIGSFLSAIDGLIPIKHYPFMKWDRLKPIKETFLNAYKNSSGINICDETAKNFSFAISSCYLSKKFQNKKLKNIALNILYNRFKDNKIT